MFLLIDEGTVKRYKTDLIDEVEPAINELIERAEQGLKSLHRKEGQLQAKVLSIITGIVSLRSLRFSRLTVHNQDPLSLRRELPWLPRNSSNVDCTC